MVTETNESRSGGMDSSFPGSFVYPEDSTALFAQYPPEVLQQHLTQLTRRANTGDRLVGCSLIKMLQLRVNPNAELRKVVLIHNTLQRAGNVVDRRSLLPSNAFARNRYFDPGESATREGPSDFNSDLRQHLGAGETDLLSYIRTHGQPTEPFRDSNLYTYRFFAPLNTRMRDEVLAISLGMTEPEPMEIDPEPVEAEQRS